MIIVTGGAGFIGSCIVARLNEMGRDDIVIVDHLNGDALKEKNIQNKKFVKYYDKQEFLDLVLANKFDGDVECLVHMGACSSTTLDDKKYFDENNFKYSCYLAKWAVKHNVRFIYASSAATYGDGSLGYHDSVELIRKLKPLNLYGESKQKFDLWVLDNDFIDKFVGIKFFNVFGPNEYHKKEMRSVVAKAYKGVMKEGKISLFKSYRSDYANGEQKRDFIYVKDAVDVVLYFFEHLEINGIFNLGAGIARSWNDLAKALFSAVGKKPCIEYVDMPLVLKDKYQYFTCADMGHLKGAGYKKPFFSLEAGIADYVAYLKEGRHL